MSRKSFSFLGNALIYLQGSALSPSLKSAIQKDSKTSADKQRASHVSAGSDTSSLNADIKEGRFRLK